MITWDTILSWVDTKAPETDELDFKRAFWPQKDKAPRSVEIAKDLAAMMNHMGGTIAVGLNEKNDACSAFFPHKLPDKAEQMVLQAAEAHIVPSEAAHGVHIRQLKGEDAKGTNRVILLVEVDPWPHGPVAVHTSDKLYRLPIRRESQTEELTWEEAMRRMDAGHRRMWLRFKEWEKEHGSEMSVMIKSAIVFRFGRRDLAIGGSQLQVAAMRSICDDGVLILFRMEPTALIPFGGNPSGDVHPAWTDAGVERSLFLPFDVMRSAWVDSVKVGFTQEDPPPIALHTLLDARLQFIEKVWSLAPSSLSRS